MIALGLLSASLLLLILYGIDVAVMFSSAAYNETLRDIRGILPLNPVMRGIVFGGGAVGMSVAAFVVAKKEPSMLVPLLLFVNGGLIIVGILTFASGSIISVITTTMLGATLIGLGVWKFYLDRKTLSQTDPKIL